jgi:hypothetical protein
MTASPTIDPSIIAMGTNDGDAQNFGFMLYPFLRVVDGAKYSAIALVKGSRRGDFSGLPLRINPVCLGHLRQHPHKPPREHILALLQPLFDVVARISLYHLI